MNSLRGKNKKAKAYRDAQGFMLDLLNLMSTAYAVELHDSHGFGAQRLTSVTDGAIKRVHEAIARYDGDFADYALRDRCKYFRFDPRVSLNEKGAVKFAGGILPRK